MWLSSSERQENPSCQGYLENDYGLKLLKKGFLRGVSAARETGLHGVKLEHSKLCGHSMLLEWVFHSKRKEAP